jgi:nicotinate-nucleotide adenylyltransferase
MAGMTRLGIFGGTFDPPHIAHLILAAEAHSQLSLDRLLWVLTPTPPHKHELEITPLVDRLPMLQSAIDGDADFELSRVDIERQPPHYALDSVRLIRQMNPQAELFYLMGGDSLHDLHTWHKAGEFVAACDFIGVMRRPDDGVLLLAVEEQIPEIQDKLRFIDAPRLEISASEIRRRISEGRPFRYFLPPEVYKFIQEHNLYRKA